jgi:hypothetical protein
MKPFFYIDGDDLMCEIESGTYKLAEITNHCVSFEEVDYLNKLYDTDQITCKLLDQAVDFCDENGYIVEEYLF